SRRRHTRSKRDWSSDVCSSDLAKRQAVIFKFTAAFVKQFTELEDHGLTLSDGQRAPLFCRLRGRSDGGINFFLVGDAYLSGDFRSAERRVGKGVRVRGRRGERR